MLYDDDDACSAAVQAKHCVLHVCIREMRAAVWCGSWKQEVTLPSVACPSPSNTEITERPIAPLHQLQAVLPGQAVSQHGMEGPLLTFLNCRLLCLCWRWGSRHFRVLLCLGLLDCRHSRLNLQAGPQRAVRQIFNTRGPGPPLSSSRGAGRLCCLWASDSVGLAPDWVDHTLICCCTGSIHRDSKGLLQTRCQHSLLHRCLLGGEGSCVKEFVGRALGRWR